MKSDIQLTEASNEDLLLIFEWRNHPQVRRFFFDANEVSIDRHREWFMAVLADSNRMLLIASNNDQKVGTLRFDITNQSAIVSIYLSSNHLGKGLGTSILKTGLVWLKNNRPEIRKVTAEVMNNNPRSMAAFTKAGFDQKMTIFEYNMATT